ncbi:PREDICTED: uncharacterized protein LOC104806404 [Tarenaya hassleriana]|uniref:uncharacterized protein LOC104806404 n=1 Tax=Tarenaya hassleriana TaxID=28532 RepID=UPI00053C9B5D|nr:PREDICTED: uncharacterized protein LOC104806404 [Tarenaya hassleriana]
MAETSMSSHGHQTKLLESSHGENCEFCVLPKPSAYHCIECDANLCEDCFKIPQEISHGHHQGHNLRLTLTSKLPDPNDPTADYYGFYFFICKGCNYISYPRGRYICDICEYSMCVECAISTTSKTSLGWEINEEFSHWSDAHQLVRCRFREYVVVVERFRYACMICQLSMWGTGYACLELKCNNFIHESCIETSRVMHHPLHRHPLTHQVFILAPSYLRCRACWQLLTMENLATYNCDKCKFALHFQCAGSTLRPMKFESHEHSLVSVLTGNTSFWCYICKKHVQNHGLRCMQCKKMFHVKCVSVPRDLEHRHHHEHKLTLMDGLPYISRKYIQSEYSCDVCEGMIKEAAHVHVYGCNECKLYAHIECLLSKEDGFKHFSSSLWPKKYNDKRQEDSSHSIDEIKKTIHDHPLRLKDHGANKLCQMCMLQINGQAYACEDCHGDNFWVHEKCAALPQTLDDHPFHPNHKLYLTRRSDTFVVCEVCGYASLGFHFSCRACRFVIDVKCAFLREIGQTFYDKHDGKTIKHALHRGHELTLVNFGTYQTVRCYMCGEELLGPSYSCTQCVRFRGFHKTCMEWPSLVEGHPIAPQHVLQLDHPDLWYPEDPECFACGDRIESLFGYKVTGPERGIFYHIECGSSLVRPLRRQGHAHEFYYVHDKPCKGVRGGGNNGTILRCASCREEVRNSYYRCLKCNLYFHFGCLRDGAWLPRTAKHRHHVHWLSLKEYACYGGYYCDICEESRYSQHPSYGCDDCGFVGHIECIVCEENASSVVLEEIESDGMKIQECSSAP